MLFGIPFSLIGSAFGALTGWLTKRSAMNAEMVAAERKYQLDAMVAVTKANTSAVKDEIALLEAKSKFEKAASEADPHRSVARRVIAYVLVFAIAFMIPGMILFGDITWFAIETWSTSGFFGIGAREVFEVVQATGVPLLWLDGLLTLVSTIVGFYFGGSAAKYSNPYTKR